MVIAGEVIKEETKKRKEEKSKKKEREREKMRDRSEGGKREDRMSG